MRGALRGLRRPRYGAPVFYWFMKHVLARPIVFTLLRVRISGHRNIPRDGPVILASNHRSYIDSVILPLVMRRRAHFLTATEYFAGRGFGAWVRRNFLRATGMLPMDRAGGSASEASLRTALGMLAKGEVLVVYPEGSRSRDGKLHRGRTGVARLALAADAPVVPVGLRGTEDVMPTGGTGPRIRLAPVSITFGPALRLPATTDAPDAAALRSATDRIMAAIAELSGQEYEDTYSKNSGRTVAR
jgi:1-acyl-sn-glycerol-3-phosphate acyltransferase